jgi:hypothetical protein
VITRGLPFASFANGWLTPASVRTRGIARTVWPRYVAVRKSTPSSVADPAPSMPVSGRYRSTYGPNPTSVGLALSKRTLNWKLSPRNGSAGMLAGVATGMAAGAVRSSSCVTDAVQTGGRFFGRRAGETVRPRRVFFMRCFTV